MSVGAPTVDASQAPARPAWWERTRAGATGVTPVSRTDLALAATLLVAALMIAAMAFIAGPLGRHLLPSGSFHFFPSVVERGVVLHKPGEEMRYLMAVGAAVLLGLLFAFAPRPKVVADTRAGRATVWLAAIGARVAIVGFAVWGWHAMLNDAGGEPPTTHFGNGDLVVAVALAAVVALGARARPAWVRPDDRLAGWRPSPRWLWLAAAALLTACWLLPSIFRNQNLAPASLSVTYHLEFTYDDFVALLNGRTPLVNYAEQYASLLPFAVAPIMKLGSINAGTFTATMCLLSGIGLLALERVCVLLAQSERVGFVLYVPVLASGLWFVLRGGSELFSWASYYAVYPMRYFGPFVLLWLCVRHLRGLVPRQPWIVFAVAGLVALNNSEFGTPALVAAIVAVAIGSERSLPALGGLLVQLVAGVVASLVLVSLLTLVVGGALPSLGLLTLYSRIFGEGGFGLLPTPVAGLHFVVYMTFVAALLVAGVRYRTRAADAAYTAALAYCGIFGLGIGSYYMGRTHPAGLVVLFAPWTLTVALLALLGLRSALARSGGAREPSLVLVGGALVCLALAATAVAQFPAPWTQLQRIQASAPAPAPYAIGPAVAFIRRTAAPHERVVVLAPLGHVIAYYAGVENVSPYSGPDNVVTFEQLDDELAALRQAGGTRFYVGGVLPEISRTLAEKGFTPVSDPASALTEWRR